jgi:hypothetical protein
VAWDDFQYKLCFAGGEDVCRLPYDETVAVLKKRFYFTDDLEKQLSLSPGDPARSPSLDRLEVKYMGKLLPDTAVLGRDVAMFGRNDEPLDPAVLDVTVRDPVFTFRFGTRTLDHQFPTDYPVLLAERSVSLKFRDGVRFDAGARAALAAAFTPSRTDQPTPLMHEIARHRATVKCLSADWVYEFHFETVQHFLASVAEVRRILAEEIGLTAQELILPADDDTLMSDLNPEAPIHVQKAATETFRVRSSEGHEFEVELPFGETKIPALWSACSKQLPHRKFELFAGGRPLERVPRAKRVKIEARLTDIPLAFDDNLKPGARIVPRAATFGDLRKQFMPKSPTLVAFSVDGDPLPLQQLAGSLAPQTQVKVERLESETFSIERNNFHVYDTVGEVRQTLRRRKPDRWLLISGARGVLPNCAALI